MKVFRVCGKLQFSPRTFSLPRNFQKQNFSRVNFGFPLATRTTVFPQTFKITNNSFIQERWFSDTTSQSLKFDSIDKKPRNRSDKRDGRRDSRRRDGRREGRRVGKNVNKANPLIETDEGEEEEEVDESFDDAFANSPEGKLGYNGMSLEHKKKRKIALVVGYVGTGYYGLQMQPDPNLPTIEGEIMEAVYKSGGIRNSNYPHPKKISWARSSRTDKGVHSIKTVISLKMMVDPEVLAKDPLGIPICDEINEHLPPQIRVFAAVKVVSSFRAKNYCFHRTYEYLVPKSLIEDSDYSIKQINSLLRNFEGTHSFHNYGAIPKESPIFVKRYDENGNRIPDEEIREKEIQSFRSYGELFRQIHFFQCRPLDDQWVVFTVRGNSFVLHQIRKMMFVLLAVVRGVLPPKFFEISLDSPFHFNLEKVPGSFLTLVDAEFSPEKTEGLFASSYLQKEMFKFKQRVILPHVNQLNQTDDSWKEFEEVLDQFEIEDLDAVMDRYRQWKSDKFEQRRQIEIEKKERGEY